jgi:hypothetical protein
MRGLPHGLTAQILSCVQYACRPGHGFCAQSTIEYLPVIGWFGLQGPQARTLGQSESWVHLMGRSMSGS